ncbi:flagellin [Hydrogenophilus thermoluteolus]|uniref:Flagellin n=2 Tax=Hydrogenophilus thermoluteolus TaxID=297 RepID=A0A2Z6DZP1_HYDTE|nr:flagellin [Hydrogenophilus thermoluteolus]BBD77810.1 flagellin [Hydrogenophilus thermoluteolus]GLW61374.1 flagellin [Hydrogenophilus thermoluteolus]
MSVINTNIMSLNAQRNLYKSGLEMQTAMQRLSSGLRINSAKDDAAGLAISERMTSGIRGMTVAVRNANDAISMAQVTEGALGQIADILQRMRDLAVQSANATNSVSDRDALQKEFRQLQLEIERIGRDTEFNGVKVLNNSAATGASAAFIFQVGANFSGTTTASGFTTEGVYTGNTVDSVTASDKIAISAFNIFSGGNASAINDATTAAQSISGVAEALSAISAVDAALKTVNDIRATLGAVQSRFQATINNLQSAIENLSASRSRIRDADFAQETAALSRAQILQQAGTAMLAQANAAPQNVLRLLQG